MIFIYGSLSLFAIIYFGLFQDPKSFFLLNWAIILMLAIISDKITQ